MPSYAEVQLSPKGASRFFKVQLGGPQIVVLLACHAVAALHYTEFKELLRRDLMCLEETIEGSLLRFI